MENDSELPRRLLEEAIATLPVDGCTPGKAVYKSLAGTPDLPRESLALLGVCAALDCDDPDRRTRFEQAAHWLDVALQEGWQSVDPPPERISFPIRILTWRALTFADRRHTLLSQVRLRPFLRPIEELAGIEAALECAIATQEEVTRLASVDVEDCQPLPPSVALLWQTWLQAECAWWLGEPIAPFLLSLRDAIYQLDHSIEDILIQDELRRLKHRAALFLARYALSLGNVESTRGWLEAASGSLTAHWETHYVLGMLAWYMGNTRQALIHLENSLTANPFQRRVRFELDLLIGSRAEGDHLPELPSVHDALAGLVMQLCKSGRFNEARESLELLDQADGPFSIRLIWPNARLARVQQAWRLRAHLAEANQDWERALTFWKIARQIPLRGVARPSDEERAHHLYLLGRTLGNIRKSPEDTAKRDLYIQFQHELGMLSSRDQLSDSALFYIGLAADELSPDASLWQRLLRANEWTNRSLEQSPQNLICLGDRLWRAGQLRDGWKAYVKARCAIVDPTRWYYISLALATTPTPRTMLDLLSTDHGETLPAGRRDLLRVLCLLAEEPADLEAVQHFLEGPRQEHLPLETEQLLQNLIVALKTKSFQASMVADADVQRWLAMLGAGLELCCSSGSLKALASFHDQYGTAWLEWCPVDIMGWFGKELQNAIRQQDAQSAKMILSTALDLGVQLQPDWQARAYILSAIVNARQHNLAAAEQAFQDASSSMPPETT